jgi:hypothetical protein
MVAAENVDYISPVVMLTSDSGTIVYCHAAVAHGRKERNRYPQSVESLYVAACTAVQLPCLISGLVCTADLFVQVSRVMPTVHAEHTCRVGSSMQGQ